MSKRNLILHVFPTRRDAEVDFFKYKVVGKHCVSLSRMTIETEAEFHIFKVINHQHDVDSIHGCEFSQISGLHAIKPEFCAGLQARLRKST